MRTGKRSTADEARMRPILRRSQNHLTKTRALPLSADDLDGIAAVYRAFYWYGPRSRGRRNFIAAARPRHAMTSPGKPRDRHRSTARRTGTW